MYCLQNKMLINILLLFLFGGLCFTQLKAQSRIKAQDNIDIKAQYLMLDEKNGLSEYKGQVVLTKDTLIVKADIITLYHNGNKLVKALIQGSPADVRHQPDNEAAVHSQAKKMEFFVEEDRLVLIGQAFVNQGNRHFSGEHIEYDTRQRIITAGGKLNSSATADNNENTRPDGRVHVIIGPDEANKDDETKDTISNE